MKKQTSTTTNLVSEENSKIFATIVNEDRLFEIGEDPSTEAVTISLVLTVDGKKLNLPADKTLLAQLESFLQDVRYHGDIRSMEDARERAENHAAYWKEWRETRQREKAAKEAEQQAQAAREWNETQALTAHMETDNSQE